MKKKYCTYSFTLVNKKFVRSFVLSLRRCLSVSVCLSLSPTPFCLSLTPPLSLSLAPQISLSLSLSLLPLSVSLCLCLSVSVSPSLSLPPPPPPTTLSLSLVLLGVLDFICERSPLSHPKYSNVVTMRGFVRSLCELRDRNVFSMTRFQ